MKDIHVFIVENRELAKALLRDHFNKEGITYASVFQQDQRSQVVEALDQVI
jgi:hypothetical protein